MLRQVQADYVSPYHTLSMNLYANPHITHSAVSVDEQLVYCVVQSFDKTIS